ncbi:LLM class flavin-dependent oxidoreductase [Halomarina pelagica]|uniref:LLM class flavin-dependent oxidoreductase n=1 Tax=Halomarina pelagica TaxID=2961599 RepID=UPI0020C3FB7C|nr:LLM class flavin-dependent oxidoreductase [Halomarina sp. BND7]
MGVTGPKMLKLAGAIADGVVLNVFVSEGYVKNALDLIDEGAREAGRERPDVGMVPAFSIDADGERAKAAVKPMVAEYVCNLPGLERARRAVGDPFFDRDDVREEVMGPVREATEAEGSASAAEHVPDWVVGELAAAGTADECVARLAEFFDYGLDFVVPSVMGGNVGYGIDAIADGFDLAAD